jgi:8-amino-7-oxononanoate synthase
LEAVRAELAALEARSLRRTLRRAVPPNALDFASNDYLDVGRHPRVLAAFRAAERAGSGGSRLLSGAHPEYAALEAELAGWTGREAALLFSSGYLAVLGAIVTLARFTRCAYSNAENHASAIDALRLAKLPRALFAHDALPPAPARETPALVVTESVFAMSGARADIGALLAALAAGDVLVVDEAHALGIVGPGGAGACAGHTDSRTIVIGTLSKALGGAGGFVAGPADAVALLATAARTFVFETAMPPALAAAMRVALEVVRGAEGERLRARLRGNVALLHDLLAAYGVALAPGTLPVVAVHVGEAGAALALAAELEAHGIYAPAIRPPTVPRGRAHVRLTVRASHSRVELEKLARTLAAARLVSA